MKILFYGFCFFFFFLNFVCALNYRNQKANKSGNAISPPPNIATLFFVYGMNNPANVFNLVLNLANLIICLLFQTAYMSYKDIKINKIEEENILKTGANKEIIPP